MKIGAMNDPRIDPISEVRWMAENGFDFVDLTLEPPRTAPEVIDIKALRKAIDGYGLEVVGHTSWGLPIGTPFPELRRAALKELTKCLPIFGHLGAKTATVHLDAGYGMVTSEETIKYNIETLAAYSEAAAIYGITVLIEHFSGVFAKPEGITRVLDALPRVGFHLDAGHANLFGEPNRAPGYIARFADRLGHVHLSDNKGGNDDMHLPLGAGTIDWVGVIEALKVNGYDGTITLEVFSDNRDYLLGSKVFLEGLWGEIVAPVRLSGGLKS